MDKNMDDTNMFNLTWLIISSVLLLLFQCGFALLEAGLGSGRPAGCVMQRRMLTFCVSTASFFLIGYGIMYGLDMHVGLVTASQSDNVYPLARALYLAFLSAVPATIATASACERLSVRASCILSFLVSGLLFPVIARWMWADGWLSRVKIGENTGYFDCGAVSCAILVGGIISVIVIWMSGARAQAKGQSGEMKVILPANLTTAGLGTALLCVSWSGFSAAGTEISIRSTVNFIVNITVSGVAGMLIAALFAAVKYRQTDAFTSINGVLAGLIAASACATVTDIWSAAAIGVTASMCASLVNELEQKTLKLDDPLGSLGTYIVSPVIGLLAAGILSHSGGLIGGAGAGMLLSQALLTLIICAATLICGICAVYLLKRLACFASKDSESPEKAIGDILGTGIEGDNVSPQAVDSELPEMRQLTEQIKISNVVMTCRSGQLAELKETLAQLGVTGLTVTNVLECRDEAIRNVRYRGIPVSNNFDRLIRVEAVVSKVPVHDVVEAARRILYCGQKGVGRIFVYDVENAVKVRTGEVGYEAMQDEE